LAGAAAAASTGAASAGAAALAFGLKRPSSAGGALARATT